MSVEHLTDKRMEIIIASFDIEYVSAFLEKSI